MTQLSEGAVLKRAIEKATKGGWDNNWKNSKAWTGEGYRTIPYRDFIFSHDFAKAFWGERKETTVWEEGTGHICLHCGIWTNIQPSKITGCNHVHYPEACEVCSKKEFGWKDALREMVLCENPIEYLRKFI